MTPANNQGFIKEIHNLCECSICYNEYDEKKRIPRVLPCQHTFCSICLAKHCKQQSLKCPFCNREYHLEKGNVNSFPKDYTRRDLKELLEKFSIPLCKECKNNNLAEYFCKTCKARICHICYSQRKFGNCRGHDFERQAFLSSSETPSIFTTDIPANSVCIIPGHENNELKYFCRENSCSKAVCANCVVDSHKNHATVTVADEFDIRKKDLQNICQTTRKKIINAKLFLDDICKCIALVTENDAKIRNSLREHAKRGIKYINDFQIEAEKNFNEKLRNYAETLERRQEQVKSFLENSLECCAIAEEAITGENKVVFLSLEKTLTEKLKMFEQSDIEKHSKVMQSSYDFEIRERIEELARKIDQMISKNDIAAKKGNCNL